MVELASIEVPVKANLNEFERGLDRAKREAEAFSRTSSRLFGGIDKAAADAKTEIDMASRSMRLFTDEASRTASALLKVTAERQRMGAAFNEKLNASFGIGQGSNTADRAADIRAYGQSLDELKAKYVPLFAIEQQYQATLQDINTAHRLGAISAEEHAAAVIRAKTAYDIAGVAAQRAGGQFKVNSLQVANLAAQFNDIAVTMAMGMNSWMVALQQGTQITQVTMGQGFRQTVNMLGTALSALINWQSLAIIGFIGLSGSAIQWARNLEGSVKTVDELLKGHKETVASLGEEYANVLEEQQKLIRESRNLTELRLRIGVDDAQKTQIREAQTALENLARAEGFMSSRFSPAKEAIDRFIESIARGEPAARAFQEEIAELVRTGELTEKVAADILKASDASAKAEAELTRVTGEVDKFADAMQGMQNIINSLPLGDLRTRLEELKTEAKNGNISIEDMKRILASLSGARPDMSGAITEFGDLAKAADEAAAAIGRVSLAEGLAGKFSPDAARKSDRLSPLSEEEAKAAMDRQQKFFDQQFNLFKRSGEIEKAFGISSEKLPKQRRTQADRDADAYRNLIKNAQDRIDQLRLEAETLGMAATEAEALRFEQKLLADATDKGRTVSEAQRQEIKALADEYGNLQKQLAETRLQQDLMFEREQMFRSPTDQRIAEEMRGAGLPVDFDSETASIIRMNEALATSRDLAYDFFSGLTRDLMNGVSATEALGNALGRLGEKLLDMALNEAINYFFQNILSAGLGGMGGGFAGGGNLNYFPPAPTFGKGAAFSRGNVVPFARGTVLDRPISFPMAGNKTGIGGEAGPEGLLPLKRDSSGNLGVIASGAGAMHFNYAPSYNVTGTGEEISSLKEQMARDRAEFEVRTIAAVRKARQERKLA